MMDPALEGFAHDGPAPVLQTPSMTPIEFFVPGKPTTKNKKKAWVIKNKAGVVKGARVAHTDKDVEKSRAFAAVAAEHAPPEPFRCPVRLELVFYMPIPVSWSKKKRKAAETGNLKHTSKPDLSRLTTFVEDTLTGVFYVDDSYVVGHGLSKVFGRRPGTLVRVCPVEGVPSNGR